MQSSNRITLNSGFRSSAGVSRYKKKQVVDELSQHQARLEMLQAENAQLGETVDRLEEELQENTQELVKLQVQNRQERELLERQIRAFRASVRNRKLNKDYLMELQALALAQAASKTT